MDVFVGGMMAEQTWQEAVAEVWQLFKETDAKFKETDARFKETDARLDKLFRDTDQKINRLEGLFGSQWGKMIEALVQPNALHLFQQRGIQVRYVYERAKSQRNGRTLEFDLLLENSHEVVVIEVKSVLRVSDVNDFLADMSQFLDFFPRYRDYRVYAGVAGLDIVEDADRYAYRQGLFVLGVVGEGVVQIKNDLNFKPKDFARPEFEKPGF
jgi:hypothetical protein